MKNEHIFKAIPLKSARESDERFFIKKRCKTAGILCVFQGFTNEFLAKKIRQNPPAHLCGIALNFIRAAAPWVAMGLLVIIFCVRGAAKNKNEKKQDGDYGTEGMCLGMCFGTALGTLLGDNTGIGISLGMLIGLAIGMCVPRKSNEDEKSEK